VDWPGAGQFIRIERKTVEKGVTRTSVTYGITSLTRQQAKPDELLTLSRCRWHIENRCFYVLDTGLAEDASRIRTGNAGPVWSGVRHAALNLARRLGQTVGQLCQEHVIKPIVLLQRLRIM
jgi:predicted transposase YbfD/YdcC